MSIYFWQYFPNIFVLYQERFPIKIHFPIFEDGEDWGTNLYLWTKYGLISSLYWDFSVNLIIWYPFGLLNFIQTNNSAKLWTTIFKFVLYILFFVSMPTHPLPSQATFTFLEYVIHRFLRQIYIWFDLKPTSRLKKTESVISRNSPCNESNALKTAFFSTAYIMCCVQYKLKTAHAGIWCWIQTGVAKFTHTYLCTRQTHKGFKGTFVKRGLAS